MKESTFQNKFMEVMHQRYPHLVGWKIHGHDSQEIGIPDYVGCVNGLFFGMEFKIQRDGKVSITPMQIKQLCRIKDAKGIGVVVAYDENFHKILLRQRRLDYKEAFGNRSLKLRIDWDFEYNHYEQAIDIIAYMIEG